MKRTLFILALSALSLSSAHAAVGDVVSGTNTKYVVDGVVFTGSVNYVQSTRFYDSNKGAPWAGYYSDGKTERDNLMCWSHVASNSIQYWQDVYGVFYTDKGYTNGGLEARALYNGYYSTELRSGYDANGVMVNDKEVGNAKEINVARSFFANWNNDGGFFVEGVDWYFRGGSTNKSLSYATGGYYSNYFGDSSSSTPAYVAKTIGGDMNALKLALAESLGLEQQPDGSYVQVREGAVAALSIMSTSGHAINCVGFNTNSDGDLVSIIVTDGDDNSARLETVYLESNGTEIRMYRDEACSKAWKLLSTTKFYHIREVSYINTPEVLQNMLSEYRDTNEAAVWSGTSSEWSTQVDVVDSEIADASTGWDVYVDGSTGKEIAEQHHGYYHGYALEGRNVLFDDHAAEEDRTVTINGTVSAGHIEVAADGYAFKMGTDGGAIARGADMTVRSGASLASEVELVLDDLELEQGALLSSSKTITVTGSFLTSLQESASFSLRNAVTPSVSVDADLDLTMATSITLNTAVDMNGHDLFLNADRPITISLSEVDGSILFFENIGTLSVLTTDGIEVITPGTDLTQYFNITSADGADLSGYSLVYANDALSMSIVPEPTTATLSLLALAALAARRRRK